MLTPTFVHCLQVVLLACCAGCTARAAPALLLQLSLLRRAHHDGLVRVRDHDLTLGAAFTMPLDPPAWSETARAPPRTAAAALRQFDVLNVRSLAGDCEQRTDPLCSWAVEAEQHELEQLESAELPP